MNTIHCVRDGSGALPIFHREAGTDDLPIAIGTWGTPKFKKQINK
jgi:hypothetical protein